MLYSSGDVRDPSGRWDTVPTPLPLDTVVRNALLNALAFCDGQQDRAARALGISARVMTYQMQRHDIPTEDGKRRTVTARGHFGTRKTPSK